MFRCETTALFTSRSSRNRSRSRASSAVHRTGALVVQDVVDRDGDLLGHFLHEGDFAGRDIRVSPETPNPMAPRRPSAVVKGTVQNDCTPFSRKRGMTAENRCSSVMSLTISGCCVFQTKPPGDSSTGNSAPGLIVESTGAASRCSRMTLRAASCSTTLM